MVIIDWMNVAIALGLIFVAIGLSYFNGFGLERDLAVGTIRSVLQLSILGFLLIYIFRLDSLVLNIGILVVMALIAAFTARNRIKKPFPGAIPVLWISIGAGSFFGMFYVTLVVMSGPEAITARTLIPLGGMMIGNTLNGISLATERFRSELEHRSDQVEVLLSLGANSARASADCARTAVKAAMIPTINALMVLGLIQIPGVMVGQVLSGIDPMVAARYQLVIMFMIVGGKVAALILGTMLTVKRYFTKDHQLRRELL